MQLGPRFESAFSYASIVHAGQTRKGSSIPTLAHLLMVAAIVLEHGGDEDEAVAALLHDSVEDGGGRERLADVKARFGERVARMVEGCTDSFETPKAEWRPRKERYLDHLASADAGTLLVSAADKLHNANSLLAEQRRLGGARWDRFRGGEDGSLWYYRACTEAFREAPLGDERLEPLVEELHRVVLELEALTARART
ncbi:MAG TPA: HD domain-containing protein [Fimbriimonas sp.]